MVKRTPIYPPPRGPFSPEAIATFRKMRRLRYGSEEWWEMHNQLYDVWLGARPWFWPIVVDPDDAGSQDEAAVDRWREIEVAAEEARPGR
jgi:hypothetical protein